MTPKRARPALFPRIPPFWLKKPGLCPNRILPGQGKKVRNTARYAHRSRFCKKKPGNKGRSLHQWVFRSCSPLLKSQNKSTADHQPTAKRFEDEKEPAAKVKIQLGNDIRLSLHLIHFAFAAGSEFLGQAVSCPGSSIINLHKYHPLIRDFVIFLCSFSVSLCLCSIKNGMIKYNSQSPPRPNSS